MTVPAFFSYPRLGYRNFISGGLAIHHSEIPRDLLELKTRLETWRKNRKYIREPIPDELRQAADEMIRCYSPSLIRSTLKLDPWKLNKSTTKKSAHNGHKENFTAGMAQRPIPSTISPTKLCFFR
ncbi:MAG: hypothetical protein IPM55_16380 [Acidobacteria bacterium]|nr:hypothetical protein [Acidobacteriota bacterium]